MVDRFGSPSERTDEKKKARKEGVWCTRADVTAESAHLVMVPSALPKMFLATSSKQSASSILSRGSPSHQPHTAHMHDTFGCQSK